MSSEPWTMCTLPVITHWPESLSTQEFWSDSASIGWLRSDVRAVAMLVQHSVATSNRTLMGRNIAGGRLGKEGETPGGQVGLHAAATHCKAGFGHGDDCARSGLARVGEEVQLRGVHHDLARIFRRAGRAHVATQPNLVAFLADPTG